jgi:hypothetical protein
MREPQKNCWNGSLPCPTAIELRNGEHNGLLSPTLSSRGGEGEELGNSCAIALISMAVLPCPVRELTVNGFSGSRFTFS